MDITGLESLAGGRTGGHPYSGPDGEARFAKMKANVVREWEEEQRKKKAEEAAALEKERVRKESGVSEVEEKKSKLGRLKTKLFGQ